MKLKNRKTLDQLKVRINKKTVLLCILIAYTVFILCETLLLRKPFEGSHLQLELFWSYKVINVQFKQMLCNVLPFIPLGILLRLLGINTRLILLIGFTFSCSIELLQYLLKLGLCELDDVFHNTLGTLIGLYIGNRIRKHCRKRLEIDRDKNTGL